MRQIIKLTVLLLALALLAGCGRAPAPAGSPAPPTLPVQPTDAPVVEVAQSPSPNTAAPTLPPLDECLACHSNAQRLKDSASPQAESDLFSADLVGQAAQVEPWEKVLVDGEHFPGSIHGLNGCNTCHGGVQSADKEIAHEGIEANPSKDPQRICGQCHPDVVAGDPTSLHSTLGGFITALEARSLPRNHPALEEAVQASCSSCHTTCGECHVSQPKVAGGGLVSGHLFNRTPSMEQNCALCHASRAGNEFLGKNEGLAADVHFSQGQMNCVSCHSGDQMHGTQQQCNDCHSGPESSELPPLSHRYAGVQAPRCETCHPAVSSGQDGVIMHQMHGSKLSCQVCHSISYSNCEGCHVGSDPATGKPVFELESTTFQFLIGRNPIQTYERPYDFVTVRHAPISPDSFDAFGEDLLSNYDLAETWTYATPHNIQLRTPQNSSCNACHGNPDLFLTAEKVAAEELKANEDVIVEQIPVPITSREQLP